MSESKNYKVICISIYSDDLKALDDSVTMLKRIGWTGANRSYLLRLAVARLSDCDLAAIAAEQMGRR